MTAYEALFSQAREATRVGSTDLEALSWRAYYAACTTTVSPRRDPQPARRRSLLSRLLRRG